MTQETASPDVAAAIDDHEWERDSAAGTSDPGRRLVMGLAKIGLATRHRAWSEAEAQGLTPTQGQILALLHAQPVTGMRVTALAEDLAVSTATATVAIQALERKGLVQKARVPEDGRARAVSLTPEGRHAAERAAGWADFLLAAVDELTLEEQEVFHRGLVKMIRGLQERREIPVSRMCVTCRFFRPHVHADPNAPHHCAFVDAPFGDRQLRLECADHAPATREQAARAWQRFTGQRPTSACADSTPPASD